MERITDIDHGDAKQSLEYLIIKTIGNYHDQYVQSDTLLLADVLKNFGNKCIRIYQLDPSHFLSPPGLAWKTCLIKTETELELLTDIDMLLIVEKGIRGGICYAIPSNLIYLDANNLYGWSMS